MQNAQKLCKIKTIEDMLSEIEDFTENGRKVEYVVTIMQRLQDMLENPDMKPNVGENIEGVFIGCSNYNELDLNFLQEHKSLYLPNSVIVDQKTFGYIIRDLTESNIDFLKDELKKNYIEIDQKIAIENSFYIRASEIKAFDKYGSRINPKQYGRAFIRIILLGFNIKEGKKRPLWKLEDIFYV